MLKNRTFRVLFVFGTSHCVFRRLKNSLFFISYIFVYFTFFPASCICTISASFICLLLYIAGSVGFAWSIPVYCPASFPFDVFFEMVLCWVLWPKPESFHRISVDNKDSCFPARESTCWLTYSFVLCSV